MIEIKVRRYGKTRKVSVKGHAKKGNDIVCAAVSCITCAFLEVLEESGKLIEKNIKSGNVEFVFEGMKESENFYLTGIEMLLNEYPEDIRVDIRENS